MDSKKVTYFYGTTKPKSVPETQDFALRTILSAITDKLEIHDLEPELLLSYTGHFYLKFYFRLKKKIAQTSNPKTYILNCTKCPYFSTTYTEFGRRGEQQTPVTLLESHKIPRRQHRCPQCDTHLEIYGPIYNKPYSNEAFIDELIKTRESLGNQNPKKDFTTSIDKNCLEFPTKVQTLLSALKEEMAVWNLPNSYSVDLKQVNNFMGINFPRVEVIQAAITNLGFRSCKSHSGFGVLITNAPMDVFFDILRMMHKIKLQRDPEAATKFEKNRETMLRIMAKGTKNLIKFKVKDNQS